MKFAEIKGNDDLCRVLAGMVDSGRIPHAILLHENDGGGGVGVALAFLQYLFCRDRKDGDSCGKCPSCNKTEKLIHPDIHFIYPVTAGNTSEKFVGKWRSLVSETPDFTEEQFNDAMEVESKSTVIAVGESKAILDILSLSALEGGYRAFLIYLPEKLNQEAANRLLKAIEEPAPKTQFVFVTHAPEKVLVTIASRCQRIRVLPSRKKTVGGGQYAELLSGLMDALVAHDLNAALESADGLAGLPSRETAKAFCGYAAERMRDIFLSQQGLASLSEDEDGATGRWAASCRKTFPRNALSAFSTAQKYIERNVSMKILFTDLVDRLYQYI